MITLIAVSVASFAIGVLLADFIKAAIKTLIPGL